MYAVRKRKPPPIPLEDSDDNSEDTASTRSTQSEVSVNETPEKVMEVKVSPWSDTAGAGVGFQKMGNFARMTHTKSKQELRQDRHYWEKIKLTVKKKKAQTAKKRVIESSEDDSSSSATETDEGTVEIDSTSTEDDDLKVVTKPPAPARTHLNADFDFDAVVPYNNSIVRSLFTAPATEEEIFVETLKVQDYFRKEKAQERLMKLLETPKEAYEVVGSRVNEDGKTQYFSVRKGLLDNRKSGLDFDSF